MAPTVRPHQSRCCRKSGYNGKNFRREDFKVDGSVCECCVTAKHEKTINKNPDGVDPENQQISCCLARLILLRVTDSESVVEIPLAVILGISLYSYSYCLVQADQFRWALAPTEYA